MKARIYSGYLSISLFFMSLLIMGVTDSYASVYFSITPDIQTLHIMPGTTVSDIQFTVRNTSGVTLHQTAFVKCQSAPKIDPLSAFKIDPPRTPSHPNPDFPKVYRNQSNTIQYLAQNWKMYVIHSIQSFQELIRRISSIIRHTCFHNFRHFRWWIEK